MATASNDYIPSVSLASLLNVTIRGSDDAPPLVFVHGFGCGQEMWRHVAPSFEADHRVVLFDMPGSGNADGSTYDAVRHGSLDGYRDDVVALLDELDLRSVTLAGHSVAAMISVLVHRARPDLVARLVLVAPSARYINDGDYVGGFTEADIDDLLQLMSRNHLGWQDPLSSLVAGSGQTEVKDELERSFCRTRADVAEQFAKVTFRADNRADLHHVTVPTLVLQSQVDAVAPMSAGRFVAAEISDSAFEVVDTHGHCPQLTAPDDTIAAVRRFLATSPTG